MSRLGFIYQSTKCIACKACQVACKDKNNLEVGTFFRRVDTLEHDGRYVHFSAGCNHCNEPACVSACPTQAMYKLQDATVGHDSGKCIGCSTCVWACPYGSPRLSRDKGIATKCNSCKDLRDTGEKPACVQSCITHCLDFDIIDAKIGSKHPEFLASQKITNPSLIIVADEVER